MEISKKGDLPEFYKEIKKALKHLGIGKKQFKKQGFCYNIKDNLTTTEYEIETDDGVYTFVTYKSTSCERIEIISDCFGIIVEL